MGSSRPEYITDFTSSKRGGYLLLGNSLSWGVGNDDVFLARVSPTGTVAWARTYGTPETDRGGSVAETATGDIVVAGSLHMYDPNYYTDGLLMHLSSQGLPVYQVNENLAHFGQSVNPLETHGSASDGTVTRTAMYP